MPSSRYYRFKSISKEERKRKREVIVFWFFFTSGFLTIMWAFFLSPFFKITDIKIPANDIVANENINQFIENELPFGLGKNLFFMPKNELGADLAAAFPTITDIIIKKELFHSLNIDFERRIQIGFWCHPTGDEPRADNCYSFDKEGIIFKEAPLSEGSLILKIKDIKNQGLIGDKMIDERDLKFILAFNDEIDKINRFRIMEFKIKPSPNIELEAITDKEWSIYLDKNQNPATTANNLLMILNETVKNKVSGLEYIDLRIPTRIFYKLR